MDEQTLTGLVGLTLVIGVGGWLNELREWMLGFTVAANPIRILGMMLSSTLVIGFVVGCVWAAFAGTNVVLAGGLVALASAVTDEGLALLHGIVRRLVPSRPPPPPMMTDMIERPKREPGEAPTEEDVHADMDKAEAEEIRALTGSAR